MSKRFTHPKIVIQIMILQEGDTMTKISNLTILKNMPEEKREFSNILFQGKLLGSFVTAEFTDCTFQDCEIKGCFFGTTIFQNCSFYGCDFGAVDFSNCMFVNCTFSARFAMCDLTDVVFGNCTFKRGYMLCCTIDDTLFKNVTFDGTWAGKLHIVKPAVFEKVSYTMGGATVQEMETAKNAFFKELNK